MGEDIRFQTWKACFSALPDPRVVGRTAHRLLDILFLTLCAVIGDMDVGGANMTRSVFLPMRMATSLIIREF